MPTDAFAKLLDRHRATVSAAALIDAVCPLLREIVNNGTMVLARCMRAPLKVGKENEDVAAALLYRHILDLGDSIEVLLSQSCVDGSTPVVRALFEASLALEYILQDDATYATRSLAWLHEDTLNRIAVWEQYDESTERGRKFHEDYRKQFPDVPVDLKGLETTLPEGPRRLRAVLDRPQFASIRAEYARLKKAKRAANWFSLFGGPKNRSELADAVNRSGEYAMFYGAWSRSAHAIDSSLYWLPDASSFAIVALRNPKHFKDCGDMTCQMMIRATRLYVAHFRGENLSPWYMREVREPFLKLANLTVEFSEDPV